MRMRYVVVLAVAVVALIGALVIVRSMNGFSARSAPSSLERMMATMAREYAVPQRMRGAANPVVFSADIFSEGRAHFADHCAGCHANDGSGDTEMGRKMYPRAPDMRLPATQRLTDGELYWIIENGVRLTGMPAWGTGGDDDVDTWKLVHFIRRLKDVTPEQVEEMKSLNPKTPSELEEEQQDRDFLQGKDAEPATTPPAHHQH